MNNENVGMREYQVRSIHFDQFDIQRVISLLDFYIDITLEEKPDDTTVENLSGLLMDVTKRVFEQRYGDK
jgi:hypothetical protein